MNLQGLNVFYDDDDIDLRVILDNLVIPEECDEHNHLNFNFIFSLFDLANEPTYKLKYQLGAHLFSEYIHIFETEHPEDLRPRNVLEATIDYCNGVVDLKELTTISELALKAYEMYHKKYNFSFNHHVTFYSDETIAYAAYQLGMANLALLVAELGIVVKRHAEKEFRSLNQNYKTLLNEKDKPLKDTVRGNFKPGSPGHLWFPELATSDKGFNNRWDEAENSYVKDEMNLFYIKLRKITRFHLLY